MAFGTHFKGAELLCAFHVLGCILSALAKDDYPRKGVERAVFSTLSTLSPMICIKKALCRRMRIAFVTHFKGTRALMCIPCAQVHFEREHHKLFLGMISPVRALNVHIDNSVFRTLSTSSPMTGIKQALCRRMKIAFMAPGVNYNDAEPSSATSATLSNWHWGLRRKGVRTFIIPFATISLPRVFFVV